MNIMISGQGLEVTPALESYVTKRLHTVERRSRRTTDRVAVTLSKEGERCHVKVHATIGSVSHDIDTEGDDMYMSIDDAKQKLLRVIENSHDAAIERRRRTPKD